MNVQQHLLNRGTSCLVSHIEVHNIVSKLKQLPSGKVNEKLSKVVTQMFIKQRNQNVSQFLISDGNKIDPVRFLNHLTISTNFKAFQRYQ